MAECPNCNAFIARTLNKNWEWIKKATSQDLQKAPAQDVVYHCPLCDHVVQIVSLVRPH